jgi:hypothetical protein
VYDEESLDIDGDFCVISVNCGRCNVVFINEKFPSQ